MSSETETETEEEIGLREVREDDDSWGERRALVEGREGEVFSIRSCLKARSFILALVVSFLVIVVLLMVIAVVVVVLVESSSAGSKELENATQSTITLDDVFNTDFQQQSYNGTWTADNLLLHASYIAGVTLYDPTTADINTTTTLINSTEWETLNNDLGAIFSIKPHNNNTLLLLAANFEKVYRHSFLADYYLYDLNGQVRNISKPVNATGRIQYAAWSPTADVIAYVLDNDIYLYDTASDGSTKVTSGGAVNKIYHGIPDWVYEEEVLGSNNALWWAPDGGNLLYASFDDTEVEIFQFPKYGSPDEQYTEIESIAYPKPGTTNPNVSLHVVDISNLTTTTLEPPLTNKSSDHYFLYAGWANDATTSVTWLDRDQQKAVYCVYDVGSTRCKEVHEQNTVAISGWIEVLQKPLYFDSGSKLLALLSHPTGDDNFTHIAQIDVESGAVDFLTSGEWEVTSILGRTGNDTLYIATEEHPWQRHIYTISVGTKDPVCLTCSQEDWNVPPSTNPSIPDRCDYFSASCSDSLEFCVLYCSGPTIPFSLMVRYEDGKFEPVKFLVKNTKLREVITDKLLPTVDMFEIPADEDGGPSLNGKITFPPNFNSKKEYPVLVYVYGGPNSQVVDNTTLLSSLSRLYFVSNLSLILVSVDGRGTGFRGDKFKYSVYKHLGEYETIDQLRAGRYLQELPYVASSKLAIYGASYGGYMAGMVGSSGSGVFRTAISQSPVTDWLYYDSIYTERYMGQPKINPTGYEDSSVLQRAKNISTVDFLLIHGTGDDNVNFQHTAQLVQALTEAEVQFKLQIYTDKAHALSGEHTRSHLYTLITDFLRESFQL